MRHRALAAVAALAAVSVVVFWAPILVAGQARSGAAATKTKTATKPPKLVETWAPPPPDNRPARTPDGQPNLQGVWSFSATYTPFERPAEFAGKPFFATEAEADEFVKKASNDIYEGDPGVHYKFTEYGGDKWQTGVVRNMRTSIIVDPPDGRLPPLTPEAQKQGRGRNPINPYWKGFPAYGFLGLYTRCVTGYWEGGGPMLHNGNGAEGETEILQTPGYVVIFTASNNDTRIIPLDGRPHLSPNTTKWFGDSRGRWEGNTLVVESTNFNDQVRIAGQMVKNMRMVERFTKRDADTLLYQFTVDDPTTWTKPWSGEVPWPRIEGPMYEASCTETNYGYLGVLKGEKAVEDAAAAKQGVTK